MIHNGSAEIVQDPTLAVRYQQQIVGLTADELDLLAKGVPDLIQTVRHSLQKSERHQGLLWRRDRPGSVSGTILLFVWDTTAPAGTPPAPPVCLRPAPG